LGSDFSLEKVTADARGYWRFAGGGLVFAARTQGGFTLGEERFQRTFAVGGFPDNNLFDVQRTNLAVLQRGFRSLPLFVRRFHGTVFADAAGAWTGPLHDDDVKTAVGASIGAD